MLTSSCLKPCDLSALPPRGTKDVALFRKRNDRHPPDRARELQDGRTGLDVDVHTYNQGAAWRGTERVAAIVCAGGGWHGAAQGDVALASLETPRPCVELESVARIASSGVRRFGPRARTSRRVRCVAQRAVTGLEEHALLGIH